MRARAWLVFFLFLPACAHDVPAGYVRYVGGSVGGEVTPVGGVTSFEVISGTRLGTFLSLEGVVRADVSSTVDEADDPPCLGFKNDTHWTSLGSRLWIDFLRSQNLDFGIGSSVALGLVHDVGMDVVVPNGCLTRKIAPDYSTNVGLALIPALLIGFEFHEHSFGLRAWFEAGAHIGLTNGAPSTISVGGFVGPMFRY